MPQCPLCRLRFHSRDIGLINRNFDTEEARAARQRVISEPSYAQLPPNERPLRLAREMLLVQRAERWALLDKLAEQRALVSASRQTISASTSMQSQSTNEPLVINHEPHRANVISEHSYTRAVTFDLDQLENSVPRNSRLKPCQQPSIQEMRGFESNPRILHPSQDLEDLNIEIAILTQQLGSEREPVVIEIPDTPPHQDDDSDYEEDPKLPQPEPWRILGTWGRGCHTRYRIEWSDRSITLNRTKEVETLAEPLLKAYRRELGRIATANTRQRQRLGIAEKIPGRGRGRGRKSG